MSCPHCGGTEECRCSTREYQPRHVRVPRFHPDQPVRRFAGDSYGEGTSASLEMEAADISEQQFSASLEKTSVSATRPRFVLDGATGHAAIGAPDKARAQMENQACDVLASSSTAGIDIQQVTPGKRSGVLDPDGEQLSSPTGQSEPAGLGHIGIVAAIAEQAYTAQQEDHRWREEVAERVHNYRVRRRRRSPRYPSLSLKFEAPDACCPTLSPAEPVAPRISLDAVAPEPAMPGARSYAAASPAPRPANLEPKVIEFPKPVAPPLPILDVEELAEPIVEGPRILDAPEALPQVPPLGGITLDQPPEPMPALELPLRVAAVSSRLTAAILDGVFVLMASALFGWIAFKTTHGMPARTLAEVTLGVSAVLWAVYQYILITYSGSTPGMEMAQVRLSRFDGDPPGKKRRRGRALAMVLSAVSFGLGYLWCLFDEDTLCWHDRITRTYAIRGPKGGAFATIGALFSRLLPRKLPS